MRLASAAMLSEVLAAVSTSSKLALVAESILEMLLLTCSIANA